MLNYLKRVAIELSKIGVLGIGILLAQPSYAASQDDITSLIKKLETQGKYKRDIYEGIDEFGSWSKKGESWFKKLENINLEEKTYNYVSANYFIEDDGSKQLSFHMFIGHSDLEHLFIHSIFDGGNGGYESDHELAYELDGKPDKVRKEYLTKSENLKFVDDFKNGKLKRGSDKNTKPDKQSERLYDKLVEKFLQSSF